jgi:hypothetical protein
LVLHFDSLRDFHSTIQKVQLLRRVVSEFLEQRQVEIDSFSSSSHFPNFSEQGHRPVDFIARTGFSRISQSLTGHHPRLLPLRFFTAIHIPSHLYVPFPCTLTAGLSAHFVPPYPLKTAHRYPFRHRHPVPLRPFLPVRRQKRDRSALNPARPSH